MGQSSLESARKQKRIIILGSVIGLCIVIFLATTQVEEQKSDVQETAMISRYVPVTETEPYAETRALFVLTTADTDARIARYHESLEAGEMQEADEEELFVKSASLETGVEYVESEHIQHPIYRVYKNGYEVEVPTELQWEIRKLAAQHGYDETIIYGLILAESTFDAKAHGENCYGLAQINPYWLRSKPVEPYRITDNYRKRDLLDPHDNLLTLMEIWNYCVDTYDLDLTTDSGYIKLLYWHNTGKDPSRITRWAYASRVFGFANELVSIEDTTP